MGKTLYEHCIEFGDTALLRQWHPDLNGELTPQTVTAGSEKKVWWRCEKGHEWQAVVFSRTREGGNGCPVCAGKVVIPGENDLAGAFPEIAAQWHPTKNGSLTPENVTVFSNRYAWWVCDKGHEYRSIISHRARGSGCPYCTNRKVLVGFNDLETVQPKIAAQWHKELNGDLTPQTVTAGSHKKVWWQCDEGHIWKAAIFSRTGARKHGCPVCAGKVKESKQLRYEGIIAESKNGR